MKKREEKFYQLKVLRKEKLSTRDKYLFSNESISLFGLKQSELGNFVFTKKKEVKIERGGQERGGNDSLTTDGTQN